jgi:predicted  nucleic acid-binding Zn-ribbon protein
MVASFADINQSVLAFSFPSCAIGKEELMRYLCLLLLFSCANPVTKAVDRAKYSAYEMVGVEKRDLFKRDVATVKEAQEDSGRAFEDALSQLKAIYGFQGGNLEKEYNKLSSSYKNAKNEAGDVRESIKRMKTVADDLFEEWEDEIDQISSSKLRSKSEEKLKLTQKKFKTLRKQLEETEKKIDPILSQLKDQVLFLKHNLNANAIAGLKTEGTKIQSHIQGLMSQMRSSIEEADRFIKTLE